MSEQIPWTAITSRFPSHTVDLGLHIRRLVSPEIAAHELAGMGPVAYQSLWPRTVDVPKAVGRFYKHPLLVDRTVDIERLAHRSELGVRLKWPLCDLSDLEVPVGENGRPLKRYVTFVCYETPRDERELIVGFDDPLALAEALWLPLLHPAGDSEKKTMFSRPLLPDGHHAYLRWGRGSSPYIIGIKSKSWRDSCGLALRANYIVPVD